MTKKLRIAALGSLVAVGALVALLGGAYYAARQVQPFYEQALKIEPEVLQRGSRELESRATALYSDAQQRGEWQALFTTEQINGWLATQLSDDQEIALPTSIRDPRVAIASDLLTLGFRTKSGGVDTVVSVDATVFLTEAGEVGIRFKSVRAGALPLPMLPLADELATACDELHLPVRWTQQEGQPVAIVNVQGEPENEKRLFYIDAIELRENELYVAGHTDTVMTARGNGAKSANLPPILRQGFNLSDYELRLTPKNKSSALKIARRDARKPASESQQPKN